jgi:hypothetical protein
VRRCAIAADSAAVAPGTPKREGESAGTLAGGFMAAPWPDDVSGGGVSEGAAGVEGAAGACGESVAGAVAAGLDEESVPDVSGVAEEVGAAGADVAVEEASAVGAAALEPESVAAVWEASGVAVDATGADASDDEEFAPVDVMSVGTDAGAAEPSADPAVEVEEADASAGADSAVTGFAATLLEVEAVSAGEAEAGAVAAFASAGAVESVSAILSAGITVPMRVRAVSTRVESAGYFVFHAATRLASGLVSIIEKRRTIVSSSSERRRSAVCAGSIVV